MLLIKCKCDCFFTVKDDAIPDAQRPYFFCQNCGAKVQYSPDYALTEIRNDFSNAGMKVQKIPDDANIAITFKA